MAIKIKRLYDKATKADGARVLVDRLWPRGVSKTEAKITNWEKDWAPSNELRKWFHEDRGSRFKTFERKYQSELKKNKSAITEQLNNHRQTITLVTAVKDIPHSHLPILQTFLQTLRK